jgi:hypothetical protein
MDINAIFFSFLIGRPAPMAAVVCKREKNEETQKNKIPPRILCNIGPT